MDKKEFGGNVTAATITSRTMRPPEPIMTSHENRWNRRELLQHTVAGAALAGLAIVPRHVLGGPGHTPPSEKYNDFRKLLDWEENNIDAVVVATPDHVHVPATMMAMKMGKHCYTEKPLNG